MLIPSRHGYGFSRRPRLAVNSITFLRAQDLRPLAARLLLQSMGLLGMKVSGRTPMESEDRYTR